MKKSVKCIIAGLIILTSGFKVFAKSPSLKVDSDKVIIVGKINVIYDESRDFIFKTRGLSEAAAERPDGYNVPYISDPSDTFGANQSKYFKENVTEYDNAETFIVQVRRPKKSRNTLMFRKNYTYYFFSDVKSYIYLPLPAYYDVDVPDDVDAIYLGTFNYYVTGDNFTISNIERIDEYDVAQEELDRAVGEHVDMARAVLKVVEEDEEVTEVEADAK